MALDAGAGRYDVGQEAGVAFQPSGNPSASLHGAFTCKEQTMSNTVTIEYCGV